MDFAPELTRAFSLDGKVAVITGGGPGLGQDAARLFQLAGARVVIADLNEVGMVATHDLLSAGETLTRKVDVSVREEVEALADWTVAASSPARSWR